MIPCLILGDSIAVGIAQHRPDCVAEARVGRASAAQRVPGVRAGVVVISLGSNDGGARGATVEHLRRLRRGTLAVQVIWIAPGNPRAAAAVRQVAAEFGDAVLDMRPGPDGVHPTPAGYRALAHAVR